MIRWGIMPVIILPRTMLVLFPALFVANAIYNPAFEEVDLRRRFGQEYKRYASANTPGPGKV